MHDANEMECLIFEFAINNIVLGKVTKSGVSDANNKLIITIFQMWGHIDPIRSGIGLSNHYNCINVFEVPQFTLHQPDQPCTPDIVIHINLPVTA